MLIGLFALGIWTAWGNTALELNTCSISSNELPGVFDGYRIAHISDLHNTEIGEGNSKLLSMLREAEPDLIAITGDLINSRNTDISYIFAGDTEMEIEEALFKLNTYFGIRTLLLEGGSVLDGAFQRAGVIDELSLVVAPVVASAADKPLFLNGVIEEYHLAEAKNYHGILRPFDGVTPYRLEMQAKLKICESKDLYSYWNQDLSEYIFSETDCVINLASREYSICLSKYLRPGIRFLTCVFGEEKNGKIIEKGTMCKMARGEMVRYMAEYQITNPENICTFDRLGYRFDSGRSDESTYIFVKKG